MSASLIKRPRPVATIRGERAEGKAGGVQFCAVSVVPQTAFNGLQSRGRLPSGIGYCAEELWISAADRSWALACLIPAEPDASMRPVSRVRDRPCCDEPV